MKIITLPVAALCLSTSVSTVYAATERDLDSHVHGGATLDVAIDTQQLFIEFETPWMNLVGFEHQPSTDEQREAVAAAMQQLEQGAALFQLEGGECSLADAHVESSMAGASDSEHEHEAEHEEHEEHEAEHEEHEEHEAEHEEHEEHESHSAVLASYVFDCADISGLELLTVGLFDIWSGIEDIDVQLAGPGGQALVELSPGNASLPTAIVR